ncbi:FAD binding domain-containing protein [Amniculicola lignicola CBS 123094]|uniref:FAD binding domain-containing protein n=1 Tax=Amniculicola lignicola CBS 123094 TaxID=1392246 RepID=A0A6A5WXS2_9PLEO|nr:FAD binding domain-containing protein [Amniculicola lignicola CBS 123094]
MFHSATSFAFQLLLVAAFPSLALAASEGTDFLWWENIQLTQNVLTNWSYTMDVTPYSFRSNFRPPSTLPKCKTYPGDSDWPSDSQWAAFDNVLTLKLIKTVPEASICYPNGSVVNSPQCQRLTDSWNNSTLRIEDPTSIRSVLFQGMTCMPPPHTGYFLSPSITSPSCTIGGFPEYVVKVGSVTQVQLAVNFAREKNLRLVIKNTGHDFGAKSVGKGSVSIWTHFLKDMVFIEKWKGGKGGYEGPAVRFGAGVQVWEANEFSKKYGVTLVGGEGKTVGHIGGYIQGGGHSPLTSLWGMAADHVLSINIVTASGHFITANSTHNTDIFWAVRGGGGSTFGVVTSMVLRAFPKIKVTTMRYNMTTSSNFSRDQFWEAQKAWVADFKKYADLGYYSYTRIRHVNGELFHDATSWIAPNTSITDFKASVAPMFAKWKTIGVPVTPIIREFDNYPDAFTDAFPQEAWTWAMRQASRFFPQANLATPEKQEQTLDAIRSVVDEGSNTIIFNMRNPPGSASIDNAVNPAWRSLLLFAIMFVTWNTTAPTPYVTELSRNLTYEWNPRWRALTPGSGTYMSESDYIEPNWQQSFHGDKYARLLKIKKTWDPEGVFYAQNAVGSEEWEMSEKILGHLPSQNSKLCRI